MYPFFIFESLSWEFMKVSFCISLYLENGNIRINSQSGQSRSIKWDHHDLQVSLYRNEVCTLRGVKKSDTFCVALRYKGGRGSTPNRYPLPKKYLFMSKVLLRV